MNKPFQNLNIPLIQQLIRRHYALNHRHDQTDADHFHQRADKNHHAESRNLPLLIFIQNMKQLL